MEELVESIPTDIISYDFNDNSTQNVVNLNFYLMKNNMFVFKDSYSFDNSVQLYSGNYVSICPKCYIEKVYGIDLNNKKVLIKKINSQKY